MWNRHLIAIALGAALSSVALAANCGHNYFYCGSSLLAKGDYYEDIIRSLHQANQPTDESHINNSLFRCEGPDDVPFVEYCEDGCDNRGPGHDDYCF